MGIWIFISTKTNLASKNQKNFLHEKIKHFIEVGVFTNNFLIV